MFHLKHTFLIKNSLENRHMTLSVSIFDITHAIHDKEHLHNPESISLLIYYIFGVKSVNTV